MFWHGRGFARRYYNCAHWFMVKCGQFSFILMYLNISNGFAGSSIYDDFIYALFDFLMTNFAIGFFLAFDSDIDFRKTDKED
jgi:magnesium-transporting ATPase (P-type)